MRPVIFKVQIPVPDTNEYKEYEFNSPKEVCDLLKISASTLYAIIQGRIKFSHDHLKHLINIKIQRIPVPPKFKQYKKKSLDVIQQDQKDFQQQLLDKLDGLK